MTLVDKEPTRLTDDVEVNFEQALFEEAKDIQKHRRRSIKNISALLIAIVLLLGLVLGIVNRELPPSGSSNSGSSHDTTAKPNLKQIALSDVAATPKGWSPIPYGNLQVSVPDKWQVIYPGNEDCTSNADGTIFLGMAHRFRNCKRTANVIGMQTDALNVTKFKTKQYLNGINTFFEKTTSSKTYFANALDVEVSARGPLAQMVMSTITRSPLSVVLGPKEELPPSKWRHIKFGGISFSVPQDWPLSQSTSWGYCPAHLKGPMLMLSSAKSLNVIGCGGIYPTSVSYMTPQGGLVVGAGPKIQSVDRSSSCIHRSGLQICITKELPSGESWTNFPGMLNAYVYVPSQKNPDFISLGLNGSGKVPLEVFDSMRATKG